MADDCLLTILDPEVKKKLFGDREVSDDLLKRFHQDIEAIKIAADQSPTGEAFPSRVQEYLKRKKVEMALDQAKLKNDLATRKKNMDFYKQSSFKDDPVEAFLTKLTSATTIAKDALVSAEGKIKAIHEKLLRDLYTGMDKLGHLEAFLSGVHDEEVRGAVWALERGEKMPEGIQPQAAQIAQQISDHNKRLLSQEHFNGVPTRMLEGRAAPRTHVMEKIRAAGLDAWKASVREMGLDAKKTFGIHAGNVEMEEKILDQIYKAVSGGKSGADSAIEQGDVDNLFNGTNFSNKLSASRYLSFDSAKGDFLYNQSYGRGNLAETLAYDVHRKSRMLGLIGTYGSNPEANLRKEIALAMNKFKREGDTANYDRMRLGERRIMNVYENLSGQSYVPGTNAAAKISQNATFLNVTTKLFFTQVKSLANLPTTAVRMTDLNGKNFLQNLGSATMEWVKTLPPGVKNAMMEDAGFFIRDFQSEMTNLGYGTSPLGRMEKFTRKAYVAAGHTLTTQGFKVASANMMMKYGAIVAEEGLESQNNHMKGTFMQMGIGDRDFKILKNAIVETPDRGFMNRPRRILAPEAIQRLDPAQIQAIAKEHVAPFKAEVKAAKAAFDLEPSSETAKQNLASATSKLKEQNDWYREIKNAPDKYLSDIQDRYMGGISQVQAVASTTAGARERAFVTQGFKQGDATRTVLDLVGQFKTYWLQDMNIMNQTLNSRPDAAALARGELKPGGKNYASLGRFLVGSTAMGVVGMSLKAKMTGNDLPDYRDPKTYLAAMAFGGAGGIYMDALAGSNKYFGMAETLLGPTVGQIAGPVVKMVAGAREDLADAYNRPAGSGKPIISKTTKKQAVDLARKNIPFQQFPGMSQFLDYAQHQVIGEYLDPGSYQKDQVKKVKKQMLKEYQRSQRGM